MESINCPSNLIATFISKPVESDKTVVVEEKKSEGPCIICCVPVKGGADRLTEFKPVTLEDIDHDKIFHWFLIHFQRCGKKNKGRGLGKGVVERFDELFKNGSTGWDGEGGKSPPLPLCEQCKNELIGLMERKKSLALFDKRIGREEEFKQFKKKMWASEGEIVKSGIYEKDKRYQRVRRYILKIRDMTSRKVKVIVKQEEKEGDDKEDWPWKDEEGEPPIIQVKQEKDSEEIEDKDPLGPEADTLEVAVENDDLDDNHDPYRNCLLCYKAISKEESALAPVLTNDLNEQNFNSVFILRKMLNVPKGRLVGYLESFGCPGKWVEYCKGCLYLVDTALRIQKEISELEDKLRKCQEKMVDTVKSTFRGNMKMRSQEKRQDDIVWITEETRQFVCGPLSPGKKFNQKVSQFVVPEVVSDTYEDNDMTPPPPSPPDDIDHDPSFNDDDTPSQVDLMPSSAKRQKLEPSPPNLSRDRDPATKSNPPKQIKFKLSSSKKPKLSAKDKVIIKHRSELGQKFLETLKETGYTCSLCPNLTKPMSFIKFYRHLIFHAQRPFRCSICNVHWSSPKELEKNPFFKEYMTEGHHLCSEATLVKIPDGKFNPGKIWSCKWCPDTKFEDETERDSHEEEKHSSLKIQLNMEYKCLSCLKGYRSYKEWLLHRVLEHPKVAGISCLFCDFTAVIQTKEGIDILNLVEMKSHVSTKHPACSNFFVSPETCDFCGIAFKYGKDYLARHIKDDHKLTSEVSTYGCPCCNHRSGQLSTLINHYSRIHVTVNVKSRVLPPQRQRQRLESQSSRYKICDICGKLNTTLLRLADHKMVRHGIDPEEMEEYKGEQVWKCERGNECGGFRTLTKRNLSEHMMKKHGAERNWKCGTCGKGFTDNYKLKRHQEIHENKGLRPYQCEICGNSFAVKNYLYIHMRLSHQNRPFASTNRKRTTKRGASRMTSTSISLDGSQCSRGIPVPPQPIDVPPTQLATTPDMI